LFAVTHNGERLSQKRLFLTGGSGFLGSSLVSGIQEVGFDVLCVSRESRGTSGNNTWVRGDITKPEYLRQFLEGCEVVVNAAAKTGDPKPGESDVDYYRVNCEAAALLAKMACEMGVKTFIQISSTGVFGFGSGEFREESPCNPGTPYERSKLAGENAVLSEASRSMMTVVVRPSNVFGEGHPWNKLLKWMQSVKNGRVLLINPRGKHWVNYVYTGDVAQAVVQIALMKEHRQHGNVLPVYIINTPSTTEEFFEATSLALGETRFLHPFVLPKLPVASLALFLDVIGKISKKQFSLTRAKVAELSNGQIFSCCKLNAIIPGFPKFGLSEGLARTAAYYRSKGLL
jgi:nucleoside-diphosphate-sugar epimerase